MLQPTVASLSRDAKFEGFLLVRNAEQRTSANGGKYLDMTLCDTTGDMNCKMWDGTVPPPKQGSVVKVRDLDEGYEEEYTIVGSQEANPMEYRVSDDSPFGRGLYGHVAGDKIDVEAPAGTLHFEIISVENG